jgi:glycosyltransferase involved in cell wall biosynthesis
VSFALKETQVSAADAAVYAPPNDEMAFAKAVARLMDDPALRARMGAIGRERVENQLNWSITSRNLVSAYNQLFGRASVPAAESRSAAQVSEAVAPRQ